MRTTERAAINSPPLPEPLLKEWRNYLDAYESGLRAQYLHMAQDLVDAVADLPTADQARFGQWLCDRLFNSTYAWNSQHYGAPPIESALSNHALVTGVVLPQLRVEMAQPDGRTLRWFYQALVGLSWRLPPPLAAELRDILTERFGEDAAPIDALRVAASDDETARRWLAEQEDDNEFPDCL